MWVSDGRRISEALLIYSQRRIERGDEEQTTLEGEKITGVISHTRGSGD